MQFYFLLNDLACSRWQLISFQEDAAEDLPRFIRPHTTAVELFSFLLFSCVPDTLAFASRKSYFAVTFNGNLQVIYNIYLKL